MTQLRRNTWLLPHFSPLPPSPVTYHRTTSLCSLPFFVFLPMTLQALGPLRMRRGIALIWVAVLGLLCLHSLIPLFPFSLPPSTSGVLH